MIMLDDVRYARSFTLEVQPGVDTAFLCMVTMVLDDLLAGGKEPPPTAPTAGTTF